MKSIRCALAPPNSVTIQPITRILAFKFVGKHGNQHRKHCIIPDKKNNWYRYYGERKRTKIPSPNGLWKGQMLLMPQIIEARRASRLVAPGWRVSAYRGIRSFNHNYPRRYCGQSQEQFFAYYYLVCQYFERSEF